MDDDKNNSSSHEIHHTTKQINKKEKKAATKVRHFYQCFCARTYQSYSALYMHVKLKHKENLSLQSLKEKHVEWSGSTKNVYYEFSERKEGEGHLSPRNSRVLRSQAKQRTISEEIPSKLSHESPISQIEVFIQGDSSILEIFNKYEISKYDEGFTEFRSWLLREVQVLTNYCNERNCEFIPFFFNPFFEVISKESENYEDIISELLLLSEWLYSEKYCPHLAVKNEGEVAN